MKRSSFLRTLGAVGASLSLPAAVADTGDSLGLLAKNSTTGKMVGYKDEPIPTVRIGLIGCGNRGKSLASMLHAMLRDRTAELVAVCDLLPRNTQAILDDVEPFTKTPPQAYFAGPEDWKQLIERDDLDLILICTPWRLHAPMAIASMRAGKHVACEVPIAYTLAECWELAETAEATGRHCIMLENCCYNEEELWVMQMVQNGVFGDLTHAEGAYLHDLRAHMTSKDYYQGQWRLQQHRKRNGNFYTTHGLGPIAMYMDIGRGDTFAHVVSMSSREAALSEALKDHGQATEVACGDMNTTLIRTRKGKTIMLQFDVHTGRPYSRINKLVGTKAVHDGYPSRLYVNADKLEYWGHRWLDEAGYAKMREEHLHPISKGMRALSDTEKQGHGGMDFIMMSRLITALNLGLPLDLNVYDGVMWSAVTPLSELSVANGSKPVSMPDFTGGLWAKPRKHEIQRILK